jgi:hypothetical protein
LASRRAAYQSEASTDSRLNWSSGTRRVERPALAGRAVGHDLQQSAQRRDGVDDRAVVEVGLRDPLVGLDDRGHRLGEGVEVLQLRLEHLGVNTTSGCRKMRPKNVVANASFIR